MVPVFAISSCGVSSTAGSGEAYTANLVNLFVLQAHPGTVIHNIDLFDKRSSLTAMWKQLEVVGNLIENIMASAKDGVHLIGYSQGSLTLRHILINNRYRFIFNTVS